MYNPIKAGMVQPGQVLAYHHGVRVWVLDVKREGEEVVLRCYEPARPYGYEDEPVRLYSKAYALINWHINAETIVYRYFQGGYDLLWPGDIVAPAECPPCALVPYLLLKKDGKRGYVQQAHKRIKSLPIFDWERYWMPLDILIAWPELWHRRSRFTWTEGRLPHVQGQLWEEIS